MLVERIIEQHPLIAAEIFVPHVVSALMRHEPLPRKKYYVCLKNVCSALEEKLITLDCNRKDIVEDVERFDRTLQREDITENAAVGLALLFVAEYTGRQVVEVTQRMEKADYWIGNYAGHKDVLLEVSGIDVGSKHDVMRRERGKIAQVREHPRYRKHFYVVVCEFRNGISVLSQNEMEGGE